LIPNETNRDSGMNTFLRYKFYNQPHPPREAKRLRKSHLSLDRRIKHT